MHKIINTEQPLQEFAQISEANTISLKVLADLLTLLLEKVDDAIYDIWDDASEIQVFAFNGGRLNSLLNNLDERINNLASGANNDEELIAALQTTVSSHTTQLSTNSDDINSLKTLVGTHTQQIGSHTTDISSLFTSISNLTGSIRGLNERLDAGYLLPHIYLDDINDGSLDDLEDGMYSVIAHATTYFLRVQGNNTQQSLYQISETKIDILYRTDTGNGYGQWNSLQLLSQEYCEEIYGQDVDDNTYTFDLPEKYLDREGIWNIKVISSNNSETLFFGTLTVVFDSTTAENKFQINGPDGIFVTTTAVGEMPETWDYKKNALQSDIEDVLGYILTELQTL